MIFLIIQALITLDLSNNQIENQGAHSIGDGLRINTVILIRTSQNTHIHVLFLTYRH